MLGSVYYGPDMDDLYHVPLLISPFDGVGRFLCGLLSILFSFEE